MVTLLRPRKGTEPRWRHRPVIDNQRVYAFRLFGETNGDTVARELNDRRVFGGTGQSDVGCLRNLRLAERGFLFPGFAEGRRLAPDALCDAIVRCLSLARYADGHWHFSTDTRPPLSADCDIPETAPSAFAIESYLCPRAGTR